jgi:hypothetical protein
MRRVPPGRDASLSVARDASRSTTVRRDAFARPSDLHGRGWRIWRNAVTCAVAAGRGWGRVCRYRVALALPSLTCGNVICRDRRYLGTTSDLRGSG